MTLSDSEPDALRLSPRFKTPAPSTRPCPRRRICTCLLFRRRNVATACGSCARVV